jgi:hypothetical protein
MSELRTGAKHKFTVEEDKRLFAAVLRHHASNWQSIADEMGSRNPRQCRERWKNYLSPGVCRNPWKPEDDRLLQEKYKEYGAQWCVIVKFFPGRTDVNVKNRWSVLTSRATAKDAKDKRRTLNELSIGSDSWPEMDLLASFGF